MKALTLRRSQSAFCSFLARIDRTRAVRDGSMQAGAQETCARLYAHLALLSIKEEAITNRIWMKKIRCLGVDEIKSAQDDRWSAKICSHCWQKWLL